MAQTKEFEISKPFVTDVRYSKDGELLVLSTDTGVQIANAKTGDVVKQLECESIVRLATFIDDLNNKVLVCRDNLDGKFVAGVPAGIWHLDGKSEFEDISAEENRRLSNIRLVGDPGSPLAFIGLKTNEKNCEFVGWSEMGEVESLGFRDHGILDFQFIPATKKMIIVSQSERMSNSFQVDIVGDDLTSPLHSIECTGGQALSVAVSADGKHAILGGSEIVQSGSGGTTRFGRVWKVELASTDKVEARKLADDDDRKYRETHSIQTRPGSDQYAIVTSYVRRDGNIMSLRGQLQMYEFGSGELLWKYDLADSEAVFSFSPDGKQIAVGHENQVDLVDCESGTSLRTIVPKNFK